MLTLYHSPRSRSSRIIRLIDELDIWTEIDIRIVNITHSDGTCESACKSDPLWWVISV